MGLRALSLLHLIPYLPQLILLSLARNINLKSTYSFILHLKATQLLPDKKKYILVLSCCLDLYSRNTGQSYV